MESCVRAMVGEDSCSVTGSASVHESVVAVALGDGVKVRYRYLVVVFGELNGGRQSRRAWGTLGP